MNPASINAMPQLQNNAPIDRIQSQNTYPPESSGALQSMLESRVVETGVNNAPQTSMFGSDGNALQEIADRIRDLVQQSQSMQAEQENQQQALYQADGSALSQSMDASMAVGMFVDMYA
jgi:hypothetical protein